MGMSLGGPGRLKADVNMTPMIDVLLVLIIIFMVITPITPKGLEALIPQASQGPAAASDDLVITVRSDKSLRLNQSGSVRKSYLAG